jgi:hypothetical protein
MSRVTKFSGLIAWGLEKMARSILHLEIRENSFLQSSEKA